MDLGTKLKPGLSATPEIDKKPKVCYPTLGLNDELVDKVDTDHCLEVGDECTATVRLRVSSVRKDEYGQGLGFEVLTLDDFEKAEGKAEEDDAEEEKTLGYKRVKSAKEAPDMDAKDLED